MKSYHNDLTLKQDMLDEMKVHKEKDSLIKGSYARKNGIFKGCAVGCGVESLNRKRGLKLSHENHTTYSEALGIPEWLARLEDSIFEGLPEKESKEFPLEFLESIPVGIDLEIVQFKFKKFLLQENFERVQKLKIDQVLKDQILKSIDMVLAVMDGAITTGKIDESAARSACAAALAAARSAESAALAAARSAARSAESAAAWSAESAALAAAWSAWSAAWSAARSAARSAESAAALAAAWSAAFIRYKNELIRLLKESK